MKRYVPFAVGAILVLAIACGGGGESDGEEASSQESASENVLLGTDSVQAGALASYGTMIQGVPSALASGTLPGITAVGTGEATAKPDGAMVRLTIGSDAAFYGTGAPTFDFVKEEDLQPVVEALQDEGVSKDDISVGTFAQGMYDPYSGGAAQITFLWPRPAEMETVLEAAQEAIRRETDYSLQGLEVMFTLSKSKCEPAEEKAEKAALEDARQQAERLAGMADLSLGNVIAISEAPGLIDLYGGVSGCDALEGFQTYDYFPATGAGSPSEVTASVSLQITFAIQ
jgi:hypothetical protein